ncbi:universal stress protein [Pseudonocardia sp. GCM10023141]|uniref:universal stress protein n=1 Tax=Pseudonocardia sp. GCM10023141 TaxID=3252653 RepID=UPI0036233050
MDTDIAPRRSGAGTVPAAVVVETAAPPDWVPRWCRATGRSLWVRSQQLAPVHALALARAEPLHARSPLVVAGLLGVDDDLLSVAAEVATQLGGPLVLAHGVPRSFGERSVGIDTALEQGERLLATARRRLQLRHPGLPVETRLLRMWPHELVGGGIDADLLVLGRSPSSPPDRFGLVISNALHHAPASVLLVPAAERALVRVGS